MMTGPEIEALAQDIREHGLRERIVLLWQPPNTSVLLDGRNRLAALIHLGVHFDRRGNATFPGGKVLRAHEIYSEVSEASVGDPATYVISANIRRRHLTKEQQAELIVKAVEAARPKNDSANLARSFYPRSGERGGSTKDPVLEQAKAVGKEHGISTRTIERARAKLSG